ncbi:MAG TPA: hypothetical protein VFZ76_11765 [Anaerolineales bacterium]
MFTLTSPTVLWILGILFLILVVALIVWRVRSDQTITKAPKAPAPQLADDLFHGRTEMTAPSLEEIVPERVDEGGFASQLQTASYNIRIETINDQSRFVVNGITYNRLEDIPDQEMRKMTEKLLNKTVRGENVWQRDSETMRQVLIGNQKTIEVRNPSHTISVQKEANQTRYIVDGLTYYDLKEVPDPELSRRAKELEQKML